MHTNIEYIGNMYIKITFSFFVSFWWIKYFTAAKSSQYFNKMLAILDMQMGMLENNKVQYMFYRKPMANKYTINIYQ